MSRVGADVAAAVIAGGKGARFGGEIKALIELDGVTILDRQLRVLQPLFAEILISANEPAPFAARGLTVVPDAVPGRGPLGGIAATLAHTSKPYLFVVGSDMPHIHTAAVDLVVGRRRADIDVVVPYANGLPEPLFAIYSRRCLDVICRRLDAGCNKLSGLLDDDAIAIGVVDEVDFRAVDSSLRALTNINSPADLP